MNRLAPEDIEAIVSGVAGNRQFIEGIVAQVKEAVQPPARQPLASSSEGSSTDPPQQDHPLQQDQPPSTQGWWIKSYLRSYNLPPVSLAPFAYIGLARTL